MDPIKLSRKLGGKIEIKSKYRLTEKNLKILYTPGVAEVSRAIAEDAKLSSVYTIKKNSVAIISDGSAVLGLGNIGPLASLPVMEGKALLFKELSGIDAFPIVLSTQDSESIIQTIKNIAPAFGGINLEDISAPRCFEIEERLKKELDIPVMHDDQHGTAVVVLAGLLNALKVVGKKMTNVRIVVSGTGAAGIAVIKLLIHSGARDIIAVDSQGAIFKERKNGMNPAKIEIAGITNSKKVKGDLQSVLLGADVFIGVSAPNLLKSQDIRKMNSRAIVFALSNPVPEIMPKEARKGGAAVIATGRSDFSNQLNNVLAFPGIFRGALDHKVKRITDEHKIKAAKAIASLVKNPKNDRIIPRALDKKVVNAVARVIK